MSETKSEELSLVPYEPNPNSQRGQLSDIEAYMSLSDRAEEKKLWAAVLSKGVNHEQH